MKKPAAIVAFVLAATPLVVLAQEQSASSKAYSAAMQTMMQGMHMQPTGDPDKDFVMMMIPHHQGAIEMAKIELQYGKDPEIRRMAKDIISAQEEEIAAMKRWKATHGQ
jgi:uncharacterized protein (DUF305 family)